MNTNDKYQKVRQSAKMNDLKSKLMLVVYLVGYLIIENLRKKKKKKPQIYSADWVEEN